MRPKVRIGARLVYRRDVLNPNLGYLEKDGSS